MFLDQLVDELRLGLSDSQVISRTATEHGHDLRQQGFTVEQVVRDSGDVCQAITELAVQQDAHISADDFRMLNQCLDNAIASAVTEFARDDGGPIGPEADDHEHLQILAGQLRTSIRTSMLTLEAVKSGSVGIGGSTGRLLIRSTVDSWRLVGRLVAALDVHAAPGQREIVKM